MRNAIKKLILWMDNNPSLVAIIALTLCIPVGIISILCNWVALGVIFGILGLIAVAFWMFVLLALITTKLKTLWGKLVDWAKR